MIEGHCHCKAVQWSYSLPLESATACNCTLCSRYGALWAYAHLDHGIQFSGKTQAYDRKINGYHFCPSCGCMMFYLAHKADEQGRLRMAVNLRTVKDPKQIAGLLIDHFDGLDTFEDLPHDGRCVRDLWF